MNNVWTYENSSVKQAEFKKKKKEAGGHATPKPQFICCRAIKSSSRENERVLDLFGGSGGLGIEAISRGCDTLYSVDHQYEAFKTIKENFSLLKLENCFPLKMDYKKALKYLYEKGIKFDYVFLDPPYGKGLVDDILQYLVDHQMLNPQACIVVEELKEVEFKEIEGIELNKRKEYGITALNIFYYED